MVKGPLTINWDNIKKGTYDLKKYSSVDITYFTTSKENLHDNIQPGAVSLSGSTLSIIVSGGVSYKQTFKNISADIPFKIHTEGGINSFEGNLWEFYSEFVNPEWTPKKRTITGTIFWDNIDISDAEKYPLSGTTGYNVNSGDGNDIITGTAGIDTLIGGSGDDTIKGGKNNDIITGGQGKNTILYVKDDGADIYNITSGEDFILQSDGISDFYYTYTNKNKDLKIYYKDGQNEAGSVTLKNFAKTDILNSAMINDTDLKNGIAVETSAASNFTGTWLCDNISAVGYKKYTDKTCANISEDYTKQGLTLKGGAGNDSITGSDYSDVIDGGADNDTLAGGKGNDKLTGGAGKDYFKFVKGEGVDTITDAAAEDIIEIDGFTSNNLRYAKNGNNLEIFYSDEFYIDNKIIVQNHFTKQDRVATKLQVAGQNIDLSTVECAISGSGKINGDDNNNVIVGSNKADTIKANGGADKIVTYAGNDNIWGGTGDDTITAGTGKNNIYYSIGDGDDTILYGGGEDTLVFDSGTTVSAAYSGNDLKVTYGNGETSNTITVKDYKDNYWVKYIKIGKTVYPLSISLDISRGEIVNNLYATPIGMTLTLTNPFDGSNYKYTIKSLSGQQKFNLNYLENGRLIVEGNYIEITANNGQKDDIILWGDHNKVNTGDEADIVRIGGAMDSCFNKNYFKQGNYNTVDTGLGDDYVLYCGGQNVVDTGAGDDVALSIDSKAHSPNIEAEINRDYRDNDIANPDGNIISFNQGEYGGDCRVLAILQSLVKSNNFTDYIGITENNNNYTVTFKNYNVNGKQNYVTFSKDVLADFANVHGDLDVVLTDYALNELLMINGDSQTVEGWSQVETATYNMLAKYIFGSDKLTAALNNQEIQQECQGKTYIYAERLQNMWNLYQNNTLSNLTIGIYEEQDNPRLGIISGHAYSVKALDNSHISLINVWDNKDVLNLDLSAFYNLNTNAYTYGINYYHDNDFIINNYEDDSTGFAVQLAYDTTSWTSAKSSSSFVLSDFNDNITVDDMLVFNTDENYYDTNI